LFVCHVEISWTICPPVMCLVPFESPRRGGVHMLCFVAFGPMVENLLNFKVFLWIRKCFVLFVMVRSLRPCILQLSVWYRQKVLGEEGCTVFVLWCSNLRQKRCWILKFWWVKKINFYFDFDCANGTRHANNNYQATWIRWHNIFYYLKTINICFFVSHTRSFDNLKLVIK